MGFPATMRRILIAVVLGFGLIMGGGYALRGPIFEAAAEKALQKASARLGLAVTAQTTEHEGWTALRLGDVRVGPADKPLVTAKSVRGALDRAALRRFEIKPQTVHVESPTFHIYGDGTLEGALRAAKDALPGGAEGDPTADGGAPKERPELTVSDGSVLDAGGAITIADLSLRFVDGALSGRFNAIKPAVGPCTFEGTTSAVKITCETGLRRPLPGGLVGGGRTIEVQRRPALRIRLPDLVVEREDGDISEILPRLQADLSVGLDRDAAGRWPMEARFPLPGGGQVVATGFADLNGMEMSANVKGLRVGPAHEAIDGTLSGKAKLVIDRTARTLRLEGEGQLKRLKLEHPALAEGPVGPFDLEVAGALAIDVAAEQPITAFKATLTGGRFVLGTVPMDITASVDNTGEKPVIKASFEVHQVSGPELSAAVPPGLLPHLQPLEFDGSFAFKGGIDLDMADIKNMKLEADPDLRKLSVVEMNPDIRFPALKHTFRTRFEMPDGELFVRTTGPDTARWTPLVSIPDLLPQAVVAQEDGGFFRHRGVSMLHLRGSLIRNLERGRFARGGSTLTMQLARNLFLHRKKTLARKLEELIIAWQLERQFGKDELIELYLNVVEFGPGIFGIGDAARHLFEKEPSELDAVQIAYLTRLLPSPRLYYPQYEKKKLSAKYATRMAALLRRLVSRGHLSQAAYDLLDVSAVWSKDQRPPSDYLGADGELPNGELLEDDDAFLDDEGSPPALDEVDRP